MAQKNILLLMGYDYVHAIKSHVESNRFNLLITKSNTEFVQKTNLDLLKSIMGERMCVSENYNKDIHRIIEANKIDVIITLGWRKLIKVEEFESVGLLINIHPALLPQYKGYHPVPYVILNEEKQHGITAHLITNEMDAGDIVFRHTFDINTFSTLPSLQYLANFEMPIFFSKLVETIDQGKISLSKNNDEKTIIKAPRRKPEDSEIPITDSLDQVFKKVKSADSNRFPAYFMVNGEKVFIKMYREDGASRQTEFDI